VADGPEPDLKAASAATYSATADHFDAPALSFWDRFGRRTVERIALKPGEHVLDACCGTGASALPAAERVGPAGRVVGLDLSEPALELARAKARCRNLSTVEFGAADVEHTGLDTGSFDAVVCVFGIFFLPDMAAGLAELWRLVRPGGRLAVTIWGPHWMEPGTEIFWGAVGAERPDLVRGFHPWTRVTDGTALSRLFAEAGAAAPVVEAEANRHPLATPDDWWSIVLGTGYRATVDGLGADAAERVRQVTVDRIAADGVREVQTNVVYAVATKA
jgi:SAM-dependent methyltransferase